MAAADASPGRLAATLAAARRRARGALPGALAAGLVAGLALPALAFVDLLARDVALGPRLPAILGLFAGSGLLGAFAGWTAAAALAGHRPPSARFAAMLLADAVATAAALTVIHRVVVRVQDGEPVRFTPGGLFVEAFGNVSSAYVVAVAGMPMVLPLGALLLIGTAAAFARPAPRG